MKSRLINKDKSLESLMVDVHNLTQQIKEMRENKKVRSFGSPISVMDAFSSPLSAGPILKFSEFEPPLTPTSKLNNRPNNPCASPIQVKPGLFSRTYGLTASPKKSEEKHGPYSPIGPAQRSAL